MNTIKIAEMSNTWGCVWLDGADNVHYGFDDAPVSQDAKAWLNMVDGNAVRQILKAGLGTVVDEHNGAYGGLCRTVSVNVEKLNATCAAYWARQNAVEQNTDYCHYCGQRASGAGFFGEPVCPECGG